MNLKDLLCREYAAIAMLAEKMVPRCVAGSSDRARWLRIAASYRDLAVELAADDARADLHQPIKQHAFF
jgi:hypothetical protein